VRRQPSQRPGAVGVAGDDGGGGQRLGQQVGRHPNAKLSYSTTGSDGASISDIERRHCGGWTAILTTGGLL
jgi:hypothetical protein